MKLERHARGAAHVQEADKDIHVRCAVNELNGDIHSVSHTQTHKHTKSGTQEPAKVASVILESESASS